MEQNIRKQVEYKNKKRQENKMYARSKKEKEQHERAIAKREGK